MTITIEALAAAIDPDHTVLLFGAGASIPSGAPSVSDISKHLGDALAISPADFEFSEICSLFELEKGRKKLISEIRSLFKGLRPTGGLLNIANFDWTNIYTTNYDDLIEKAFLKRAKEVHAVSSSFDFGESHSPASIPIYKIHGTIGLDVSEGHHSRMILTSEDNDQTEEYREEIFDHLRNDLNNSNLIIVGYSLSDEDLRAVVQRAIQMKQKSHSATNVYLLLYTEDENRAKLYERRGIRIAFGSIDDFFHQMEKRSPQTIKVYESTGDILSANPVLNTLTFDIKHQISISNKNFGRMYSGSAPSYADISAGFTFERSRSSTIIAQLASNNKKYVVIIGASGVGKTTLARQVTVSLVSKGKTINKLAKKRQFM